MAIFQGAQFSMDPRLQHEQAFKQITRYLKQTSGKGLIIMPDFSKGFKCCMDADFAAGFSPKYYDEATVHQCVTHTHQHVTHILALLSASLFIWSWTLQAIITLSTTEAEYITLSTLVPCTMSSKSEQCHLTHITTQRTLIIWQKHPCYSPNYALQGIQTQ